MNKLEFSKLKNKEDMIMAFNQLKDDYRQFFVINEEQQEEIEEKDKEIERLNKECDTYMKIATKKDNIINELENWLNIQQNISSPEQIINDIFDKIKELKEKSDKKCI